MKETIKKMLPSKLIERIQRIKTYHSLCSAYKKEAKRFAISYAAPACTSKTQIESLLIFYVHQIEKGFSFDAYQYGRGKNALHNIALLIKELAAVDVDWRNNIVYKDAVLALGEYRHRHMAAGRDISYMTTLFPQDINAAIIESSKTKYPNISLSYADKKDNDTVPFSVLVERRHAIRSYSDKPVCRKELEQAIRLSLRTPSVCNRQPARIRIFTDIDIITQALKIQGGFGGYNMPPALMLITADLQAFMGINERNEGYVDGGLFPMSLLYSLETCGLAACPLNTMFNDLAATETRRLLHVPDNEVFVMYIAVGHFRETSRICRSQRFGLDRILMN